jgi:hypothetical protein
LRPEASKLIVPQGGTVAVPVEVVRTTDQKVKYTLASLAPPTGLGLTETEIGETATNAAVKITAAADAPLGPLTVALIARVPARVGAAAARLAAGAAARKGAAPPQPSLPAVAAAMIAIEVVRPARPR